MILPFNFVLFFSHMFLRFVFLLLYRSNKIYVIIITIISTMKRIIYNKLFAYFLEIDYLYNCLM